MQLLFCPSKAFTLDFIFRMTLSFLLESQTLAGGIAYAINFKQYFEAPLKRFSKKRDFCLAPFTKSIHSRFYSHDGLSFFPESQTFPHRWRNLARAVETATVCLFLQKIS